MHEGARSIAPWDCVPTARRPASWPRARRRAGRRPVGH